MHVGVVGAGLAGLVGARRLAERGHEVTVYETEGSVGGRVSSLRRDGYVFDRGFQVLFTAYPAAKRELSYPDLDLRRFRPGAVICRPGHRAVISDPLRDPRAAVETALTTDLRLGDKLRILRLRRRLRQKQVSDIFDGPDETIASYLEGFGFSERFVQNFAAPFYGGITLDRSLQTSKRVFEFTFKMLTEGDIAVPARGMGAIPEQLAGSAREAGVDIATDRTVTDVVGEEDAARIHTEADRVDVDAAIVATDPPTAASLTGLDIDAEEMVGCTTQYYRLPGSDLGTGRRLLLNSADTPGPNQIVPVTGVAPEHAPDETTVLSATFLSETDAPAATLAERTHATLEAWYPERSVEGLEPVETTRVPAAQFRQPPGIHDHLPDPRSPAGMVYLAGDYTRSCSINGALESGRDAAVAVAADTE
jgi:phytoene dehydrogenase-like protein